MILARTVVELSHKQIVDTEKQTQTDAGIDNTRRPKLLASGKKG